MGGILYSDTCSEKCKLLNSTQCEQAMYHSQRERTMQFNNDTAWLKIKALEANQVINYYYIAVALFTQALQINVGCGFFLRRNIIKIYYRHFVD
jgi:hypothetical protein